MMTVYLGALAFGGTLLIATMVMGAGGDADAEHDHGGDGSETHGHGDVMGWLPITSLRFWTYFLGFGGLAGASLTWLDAGSRWLVAAVAFVVGWACGAGVMFAMRSAHKGGAGSEVELKDLRGETAEVLVAIAKAAPGKVRLTAKGRTVDLIAETDEDRTFASGSTVMIVGEGEEGRVTVASV